WCAFQVSVSPVASLACLRGALPILRRSLAGLGGTVERSGSGLASAFARGFISNVVFSPIGLIAGLLAIFTVPIGALTAGATLFGSSLAAIVVGAFALRGDREIDRQSTRLNS